MTEVTNFSAIVEEFCSRVIAAHNSHYKNGVCDLIDIGPGASPNGNQIYHLYSTGEITYQKGAWAYLQRSEFTYKYDIIGASRLRFNFVKETDNGTTYAVLTEEECETFRKEMQEIINTYKR
jgi:hypothetical protein